MHCISNDTFSLCSNQTAWRKANLASKLSIDQLEKEDLLNSENMSVRHRSVFRSSKSNV